MDLERRFENMELSGAVFRSVDLSRTVMRGVLLADADIDGVITGLTINGVAVGPLVEAELDRLYPERVLLRPDNRAGLVAAIDAVDRMWSDTIQSLDGRDPAHLHASVDGEWSIVETLRHLVFVIDAWFFRSVLDENSFHPIGIPPDFLPEGAVPGVDRQSAPTVPEVLEVRAAKWSALRNYAAATSDVGLTAPVNASDAGFPPAAERTPLRCLEVLFSEEWAHHRFAVRDLARLGR